MNIDKEKFKRVGEKLGKLVVEAGKFAFGALQSMQSEYNAAQDRLDKHNIDEWDEDELNKRLKYTVNSYESMIIRQKLSEKKCNSDED